MNICKIEEMDDGRAYLLTYSREGSGDHKAFASLDRAKKYARLLTGRDVVSQDKIYGNKTWYVDGDGYGIR